MRLLVDTHVWLWLFLDRKKLWSTFDQTHAFALQSLPWHHEDPFDRMLIAQAVTERLTLVTADAAFQAYPVALLRAA